MMYLLYASLLLLPACMVGPRYKKPQTSLPATYTRSLDASGEMSLSTWWQQFNDQTLTGLINDALAHNYDIAIAYQSMQQARSVAQYQGVNLYPQVDVTTQTKLLHQSRNVEPIVSSSDKIVYPSGFFQLGFDAVWELDFWGRLEAIRSAAYHDYRAAHHHMNDIRIMVAAEVAQTYLELCWLHCSRSLRVRMYAYERDVLRLLQDRLQAGLSTQQEVHDQSRVVLMLVDEQVALRKAYEQALIRLQLLRGSCEQSKSITCSLVIPMVTDEQKLSLPSELLRRRPDIRKAEHDLIAATHLVSQAAAGYFPQFTLYGTLGAQSGKFTQWLSQGSLAWDIGPSVRWPLLHFGRIRYQVNERNAARKKAFQIYAQAVATAFADVEQSLSAYAAARDTIILQERMYNQVKKNYDLQSDLMRSGLADQLTWLQRSKDLIAQQQAWYDAQYQASRSVVALYKALGGGW